MKKNYIELGVNKNYIELNKNYIELNKTPNVEIKTISTPNGFVYNIQEIVHIGEKTIAFCFNANQFGQALNDIIVVIDSFVHIDNKDFYNKLGMIGYKIDLLERIRYDLFIKQKQILAIEEKRIR